MKIMSSLGNTSLQHLKTISDVGFISSFFFFIHLFLLLYMTKKAMTSSATILRNASCQGVRFTFECGFPRVCFTLRITDQSYCAVFVSWPIKFPEIQNMSGGCCLWKKNRHGPSLPFLSGIVKRFFIMTCYLL